MQYNETFRRASELLNTGHTKEALTQLEQLLADTSRPPWELMNNIGLARRLLGRYEQATDAFSRAYSCAIDNHQKGQTMRDWAMVPLEQGKFVDALRCIDESLDLLSGRKYAVEYAVSLGFLGRIELQRGNKDDAEAYLRRADTLLQNQSASDLYILNNLVWWMKAVGPIARFKLAQRAMPLANTIGNSQRVFEICLITLHPRIAAIAKAHLSRR